MGTVKQFAVIGLGRFGTAVGASLVELGHEVLGIDEDEDLVQHAAPLLTHVVQADATDEEAIRSLGMRNFDAVIVAIGSNLEASILVTLQLKELGVKNVVAKASTESHGRVLQRIGVDRVVFPERDMGVRVAHQLVANNLVDYIDLSPDYSVLEMAVGSEMHGRSLKELALRNKYGVNVVAIKRGDNINMAPRADDVIQPGDIMVLIGSHDGLRKLEQG